MPILCATNFSPEAIAATTVAAHMARQRGEELWLVFVMPANTARAFGEEVFTTAEATLKGEASRIRKLGATVTTALLLGKLHQELPRFAADNKVDLVIAGDTRKEPNFIGTGTLGRLAQHLEAPLWVIRDPAPLIAWTKGERPLKVMLAMDRTQSTQIAADWLGALARFGQLEVVGGHVYWPAEEALRMGFRLPATWDDSDPEMVKALQQEFLGMVPSTLSRVRITQALGRASEQVTALATEEGVDLLVLGTHHRQALGQLWSVSQQCLQFAPMSVASIPAGAGAVLSETGLHPLRHVLGATDFSPTGDRALSWALSIVEAGGRVDLLHVIPAPVPPDEERAFVDRLLARVPPEIRSGGVEIEGHVVVSANPGKAIAAAAERYNSQVICVGSRGHSGLIQLVLGSTAQAVLTESDRPVMVIRPAPS